MSASVGSRRFQALLCSAFGGLALLLAALGLYGLIAWSVAQRTREIGIRMALGAEQRSVLRMIVLEGLRLAGAGLGIGLLGALAVSRALQSQLYGISSSDPLTYVTVAALIAGGAALASLLPAPRRLYRSAHRAEVRMSLDALLTRDGSTLAARSAD